MRARVLLPLALAVATVTSSGAHATPMPPPGDPDTPIYCDYGHVNGSATYTPNGISMTPNNNHYVIDLEADCPAYQPILDTVRALLPVDVDVLRGSDDAGHYSLRLEGDATGNNGAGETCVHGESHNGVITGNGPEGPIAGTFWFHREYAHYWVSGTMSSGGEVHRFTLWIDIVPTPKINGLPSAGVAAVVNWTSALARQVFDGVCGSGLVSTVSTPLGGGPIRSARIIGHGTIRDPGDNSGLLWDRLDDVVQAVGGLQQVG